VIRPVPAGVAVKQLKKKRKKLPGFVWQQAAAVSRNRVLGAKTKQASMSWPTVTGQAVLGGITYETQEQKEKRVREMLARRHGLKFGGK
jgi:hypothetical protein